MTSLFLVQVCLSSGVSIPVNLIISPYFSFIGNLGNSYLSLFKSIKPECWQNAN